MPDSLFADARLAQIYDVAEQGRTDLDPYLAVITELGAHSVMDLGCGTGTFACLLARVGREVVAVDPAGASIDVARHKPYAEQVRWLVGDHTALPPMEADAVTMTGNVAQVFISDAEWKSSLKAIGAALRPGGMLVFEARDPAREAWLGWNRKDTWRRLDVPGVGVVERWEDLVEVTLPLVSFRTTFVFQREGATLTSTSTLRFRSKGEVVWSLLGAGFSVEDIRDAPDRPGLEFVFLARRVPKD
jgi:SAM-dependent methyltransferase